MTTQKTPTPRGGARKGAGRKKGRAVSSATITLPNETWAAIDEARGEATRSKHIDALAQRRP